jgi:hypothetical protein
MKNEIKWIVKFYDIEPSSHKLRGCEVKLFKTYEECVMFLLKEHWILLDENDDTDLTWEEFCKEYKTLEDIWDEMYEDFEYDIEEVTN